MTRRRRYGVVPLMLLPLFSLSQNAKQTFEITGTISGLKNDSVVLMVPKYDAKGRHNDADTLITMAVNGGFLLKGSASEVDIASLQLGGLRSRKSVSLFLETGEIVVRGHIDSLSYATVTGTSTNNDHTKAQLLFAPLYDKRTEVFQKMRKLQEGTEEYEKLNTAQRQINNTIDNYRINYMETHPSSKLSLTYLYVLQDKITTDQVEKIYNSFSPAIKKSPMAEYIYSKLQANKSVAIGKKAHEFISTDPEGRQVKLSEFKGKYVLLEFWAQWCVPCRAQHPHLREIYNKYKNKGFTILQYSVDVKKDEQKWKDAIKKDGLVWTQVSDLSGLGDGVAKQYGVQPIPDNFLISPEGVILGRRLSPKELEEQLARIFH